MVKFNFILVLTAFLYLNMAFERVSTLTNRCPKVRLSNGVVRTRSMGRVLRVSCNWPFKLVSGNELMTCVRRTWDSENPICARSGCPIVEEIAHGRLDVTYEGARLEVVCDVGYAVDGPSFVYCNEHLEWNDVLIGCKEIDQIYFSCDFESSDDRFCGWKNDNFNDVDWLADRMSFLLFTGRRHVTPGSSQYFTSNYVSLYAGDYGSSTTGRLLSPPILPLKNKQKCLIFSYKVTTSGTSQGNATLLVTFGGIPHWATYGGEGRVIIGLYKLNFTSKIIIEGKNCETAIDNIVMTEGHSCTRAYEEEVDTCYDNCGRISNGNGCSCDWECHSNNNCCGDIRQKCPYIKPPEEIATLYLTTTTTARPKQWSTTVKNNVTNRTTVPSTIWSSKTTDESKVASNGSVVIVTISKTEHNNATIIETANATTPAPAIVPNVTYPTFPPTPPTSTTTKPITITVTIPSTTPSTETPKVPPFDSANRTSSIDKTYTLTNISTATAPQSINMYSGATNRSMTTNTTSTTPTLLLYTTPNTTIKPLITNATTTPTKKVDIPWWYMNVSNTSFNVLTLSKLTSATPKLINTPSTTTVRFITANTTSTTPINAVNSNSTHKPLTTNTTGSTRKTDFPHINILKAPFNVSTQNTNNISTVSKSPPPNAPIIAQNGENKPTTTTIRVSDSAGYSNISSFPDKPFIVFDPSRKNPYLTPYEYNTTFNNNKSPSNKNGVLNITTEFANRSALKFEKNAEPIGAPVGGTFHRDDKPQLNYSLYKQHMENVDKWLTENAKQNSETSHDDKLVSNYSLQKQHNSMPSVDKLLTEKQNNNAKSSSTFHVITVVKYLAAIGVVLVTFKYTLSFVKWYTKKPRNDEMDACFVETDTESYCNMELTSNNHLE